MVQCWQLLRGTRYISQSFQNMFLIILLDHTIVEIKFFYPRWCECHFYHNILCTTTSVVACVDHLSPYFISNREGSWFVFISGFVFDRFILAVEYLGRKARWARWVCETNVGCFFWRSFVRCYELNRRAHRHWRCRACCHGSWSPDVSVYIFYIWGFATLISTPFYGKDKIRT